MQLFNRQQAIDFSVKDIYGQSLRLFDFKRRKDSFGLFQKCKLSVLQLTHTSIIEVEIEFFLKRNLKIRYFFESDANPLLKGIFHWGIFPTHLIGDPKKVIYILYGVESSMKKMVRFFANRTM